jgi:hypothetical protein
MATTRSLSEVIENGRSSWRLGRTLLLLPSLALATIGLLIGACSVWTITDYEATTVENDTPNLRALCQDATALKPEMILIGPGEQKLAHRGVSCPVFDIDGSFVSCIRGSQIDEADGGTVLVSEADTSISIDDCPNSRFSPGPLDLSKYQPSTKIPSRSEQHGTGYAVLGLFFSLGFIGASFIVGRRLLHDNPTR